MSLRPSVMVVLAAGEGTRMRSAIPKVLHEIAGRPLIGHVLAAAAEVEPDQIVVVVGHGRAAVTEHLTAAHPTVQVAVQHEQRGTGHAVRMAMEQLPAPVAATAGPVVVLAGDTPLLTGATLRALVDTHQRSGAAATVLSARLLDPAGYGRIVRNAAGEVTSIVEHKDADDAQREIAEVNSGVYAFSAAPLVASLGRLSTDNAAGEEYLTDVLELLRADGLAVAAAEAAGPTEILGVNDRSQLAVARALLRDRIVEGWMRAGVTVVDPATTWIDVAVELSADTTVHPQCQLHGATTVAAGAEIGPDTTLRDVTVAENARVRRTEATGAQIGAGADVGPFAYLRPGTVLGERSKVGAYVETKSAVVGAGSKVPHLSYVGDAEIGEGSNIGAATIFVNYDGVAKHRVEVGDHARVGSDSMLVAPVTIGDGAYTAAGSVVTEDVPPGAMAVGRARQRNIEGWVARKRPGSAAAQAAAKSSGADQAAGGDIAGEQTE